MISLIMKKEVKSFFKSPMAFVLSGLFSLVIGWIFFNLLMGYIENIQALPTGVQSQLKFINAVVIKLFGNMNFLLMMICPVITMKIFSEEKRDNTLDLYFASPMSDYQLVLGKYLSTLVIGGFLLLCTLIFPLIMYRVEIHDWTFLLFGYLGAFLNIACYMSVGLFCSSLTRSQMISALTSFSIIMLFWLVSWILQLSDNFFLISFVRQLTIVSHYEMMVKGFIGLHDIVFYISFIFFFIFLTLKSLAARNW
jgi:ABC-2 type transport system permease protein